MKKAILCTLLVALIFSSVGYTGWAEENSKYESQTTSTVGQILLEKLKTVGESVYFIVTLPYSIYWIMKNKNKI